MKKVIVPSKSFDSVPLESIDPEHHIYVWGEYKLTWLGSGTSPSEKWAWTPILLSSYLANGGFPTAEAAIEHVSGNNKPPVYELTGKQQLIDYIDGKL